MTHLLSWRASAIPGLALLLSSLASAQVLDEEPTPDPSKAEVFLEAEGGWEASLVVDNGETGIWTVDTFNVFPQYGTPEIIGLDDDGRCHVLIGYSGKWTDKEVIHDGAWLGGLGFADIDPRIDGPELYTGGKNGNLYQVNGYMQGVLDCRLIATLPGREIHTIVAEDVIAESPGAELIVFTRPGGLFRVKPTGEHGRFVTEHVREFDGRVRDAQVLPAPEGAPREVALVSRNGRLDLLRWVGQSPHFEKIYQDAMGLGRIELAPGSTPQHVVLYSSHDDGRILRHERVDKRPWVTEHIYDGPQGMRGIAAGVFAGPDVETLAVFGYSGQVELLARTEEGWTAETIFVDRDKGHWLKAAELDGRNSTREIIGSGYGGRIFLLKRPPGYGHDGVPAFRRESDEPPRPVGQASDREPNADWRVAVRARAEGLGLLSTLRYSGGFQTKTPIFQTLVRRDETGRIVPALATAWRWEREGKDLVLEIDPDARWQNDSPVTAQQIVWHLRRWVGLPEHAWLGMSDRVRDIVAEGEHRLRLRFDRPWAALADLCAINPGGVIAPSAFDREGEYRQPLGSGLWRFVHAKGRRLRLASKRTGTLLDLVAFEASEDPVAAWEAGQVDVLCDGWSRLVPRDRFRTWKNDSAYRVSESPGSSVTYLSFRLNGGATATAALRRKIAQQIDRAALIEKVEHGWADPTWSWAAAALTSWPRSEQAGREPSRGAASGEAGGLPSTLPLALVVNATSEREVRLAEEIRRQMTGPEVIVVERLAADELARRVREGDYDLRLERTWGSPYDPELSLRARFLPPPSAPNASSKRFFGVDARLEELVAASCETVDDDVRSVLYRRIQDLIDRDALIVPLYAPRRLAVARRGVPLPRLGTDLYRTDWSPLEVSTEVELSPAR